RRMHNSERFRCIALDTNRGQRADDQPRVVRTPRTTVAVRRTRDTTPVARVRYHSAVGPAVARTVADMITVPPGRASHPRSTARRPAGRVTPAGAATRANRGRRRP